MIHPFGGLRALGAGDMLRIVILLEIGLIVALVIYFVAMDLYIRGCEKL